MIEQLTEKNRELADYMSDLSEQANSAGWMEGLEYVLWNAVLNGPQNYGRLDIEESHINKLRTLSNEIDGWIYFDDDSEETYIALDNWLALYSGNANGYVK